MQNITKYLSVFLAVLFEASHIVNGKNVRDNPMANVISYLIDLATDSDTSLTSLTGSNFNDPSSFLKGSDSVNLGSPTVRVENGLVVGRTVDECHAFYSVPYAKAPVGRQRFQPPGPFTETFDEPYDASYTDQTLCYQVRDSCIGVGGEMTCKFTEDCLKLNIWVPRSVDLSDPENRPADRLPVMFWIHGGYFYRGYNWDGWYDGRWIAEATNMIVVGVNYRVGALGFLAVEDENGKFTSNAGLKDQQAAMQWVQDNIEAFGGNKDLVTLVGESAGGQSITFHITSEVSRPLYHRAIIDSNYAATYQTTQNSSSTITERTLKALNCSSSECLWEMDASELTNALDSVIDQSTLALDVVNAVEPYRPTVDGSEWTEEPVKLCREGKWNSEIPVIIGTNNEEMSIVAGVLQNVTLGKRAFEILNRLLIKDEVALETVLNYYKQFAPSLTPNYDYSEIFAEEITDLFFTCQNRAIARYASKTAPEETVYLYNYAFYLSYEHCKITTSFWPSCNHSYHSEELPFLFKNDEFFDFTFTEEEAFISDMISQYWGNHMISGNPSTYHPSLQLLPDLTLWPPYVDGEWINIRYEYPMSTLEYDAYSREACDMWEGVYFYLQEKSETETTTSNGPTSSEFSTLETSTIENELTTSSANANEISLKVTLISLFVFLLAK